jgi:hypothetical protein
MVITRCRIRAELWSVHRSSASSKKEKLKLGIDRLRPAGASQK